MASRRENPCNRSVSWNRCTSTGLAFYLGWPETVNKRRLI
jgi:hypothetical protein